MTLRASAASPLMFGNGFTGGPSDPVAVEKHFAVTPGAASVLLFTFIDLSEGLA